MKPCRASTVAKAKQKNLTEVSEHVKSDNPGERMILDLASFKPPRKSMVIPKPNWRLMVDESKNFKITGFYKNKSDMVEPTCVLIEQLKYKGHEIKFLCMDNAGGNQLLEIRCKIKDWHFVMEFEYTARATPQHNNMAMVNANITVKYRYHLFREAFSTATDLDDLAMFEIKEKRATRYEDMIRKNPEWAGHLKKFGETGTFKTKTDTVPKLHDKGVPCMFVGYAENHKGGVYRMWNPQTRKVHITLDVIVLK
jgi:hypothetical protein